MHLSTALLPKAQEAIRHLFEVEVEQIEFQPTRKDFEGDITLVVFPLLRQIKGNPAVIGQQIGEQLQAETDLVESFNVVKGFLNLVIAEDHYLTALQEIVGQKNYGTLDATDETVMVEYSSPNTNKPLHLGHIRNNLLGYSVAEILRASGRKVLKTQIINDRGIHICKSMLAWKKKGQGETPESSGLKGDHLVGKYYVEFDKMYKADIQSLIDTGATEEEAKKNAPVLLEAQELLRQWEAGEEEVVALWKTMNGWVYEGFDQTYKAMGVDFDQLYYESDTYLLGKDIIEEGLEKGVFFRKEDGSVWIDLSEDGLDEKIVLRADGTAVYMTQDIGTAIQRVKDFPQITGMVYTVGNEQDYHFKVLFLILQKLGYSWAEKLYHLSYGMVDLPSGKMKSREGTVVDADDLIQNMSNTAEEISSELGKLEGYSDEQKKELYHTIGLGALKYYILKVDPRKRILFNPEESVDFQGNTGPFIQYTYARIQSILRKYGEATDTLKDLPTSLHAKEKEVIKALLQYPEVIELAASQYSPALIANYVYDLVKEFNSYYQQVSILGEEDPSIRHFRVVLSAQVGEVIKSGFRLLGINVPERM